jgi:hypothetical protein
VVGCLILAERLVGDAGGGVGGAGMLLEREVVVLDKDAIVDARVKAAGRLPANLVGLFTRGDGEPERE